MALAAHVDAAAGVNVVKLSKLYCDHIVPLNEWCYLCDAQSTDSDTVMNQEWKSIHQGVHPDLIPECTWTAARMFNAGVTLGRYLEAQKNKKKA